VRKKIAPDAGIFQVYSVQIGDGDRGRADDHADANLNSAGAGGDGGAAAEDMRLNYNVGGICLSEAAFHKLQQEISLSAWAPRGVDSGFSNLSFTNRWIDEQCEMFVGTVPIANGVFRKIAIRRNRIAQVDVRDLSILRWTDRCYYEVCANPAVHAALPGEKPAAARR
jgi:hypothetical protein